MRRDAPPWRMVLLVALAGLNLRASLAGVQALSDDIASALGLGGGGQGLLSGQLVLFLGIGAPVGHAVARRWGLEQAVTATLAMIAAGGFGRMAPGLPCFLVSSTIIGIGMGMGTVLVPVLIVKHVRRRRGLVLGVYATAMGAGLALGAAVSIPLAGALQGWQPALAVWGAIALITALVSLVALPDAGFGDAGGVGGQGMWRLWRSPTMWLVTGYSTAGMLIGFSVSGWIVAYYLGLEATAGQASAALVLLQLAGLAGMLVAPAVSDLVRGRTALLLAPLVLLVAGVGALLAAPFALGVPAAIATGLGIGGASTMTLVLISDRTSTPHEASRLTGMVMFLSYPPSAAAPVVVGVVRDATGSLVIGLACSTVLAVACLVVIPLAAARAAARRPTDAR